MIDFSVIKTPEEKLLALFLFMVGEKSPKQIYTQLNLNKSKCITLLNKLEKNGILKRTINEHGITLYSFLSVAISNPPVAISNPPVAENPAQLTKFKQTQQTNKKKKFEEENTDHLSPSSALATAMPPPTASSPATPSPLPLTRPKTRLVTVHQRSKPQPTPQRPDMPSITIPKRYPKVGSFDGFIFATELPREKALDRMLEMIQFEAPAQNATFPRYELFKTCEIILFEEFLKQNKAKLVFDDVVQRIAFAAAMEVPEFKTLDELKKMQKKWKQESKSKMYTWVPALQILRQIYYFQQWGWETDLWNNEQTWSFELNHAKNLGENPRIELFPSKKWELDQEEKKKNSPKIPNTPTPQKPQYQTPEETKADYIKMLRDAPNNQYIRAILIRNYRMTSKEIDELLEAEALVAA